MPETLYRLVYEATIDEAVDVGMRLANRTRAFRTQFRQNTVIAGIVGGGAFMAAWLFYLSIPGPFQVPIGVVGGPAFGVIFAFVFKRFFLKEIVRQSRKVFTEQFGGKPTVACELELRSDAVWVRQAGMEMSWPWTLCTGIQDQAGDIEMRFAPGGICVVRNRYLASPAERQRFLDTARRLAGK